MLLLLSLISILTKVYCLEDIIPFSHEALIVPLEDYNDESSRGINEEYKQTSLEMNSKSDSDDEIKQNTVRKDRQDYCSTFQSCFECVKSVFYHCDWCHNMGCTSFGEKHCPYAVALKNANQNNLKLCPYIQHPGPILLSSGIRSHIAVKLHAPDPILNDMDIICQIRFKNRRTHLKGMILQSHVYCYPVKLDAIEYRKTQFGSFRIIWGGVEPYSNEVPVTVYSCGELARDCESCRLIAPEFGCGWCDDINSCATANQCEDVMNWSLNRLTCKYNKKKMFYV